MGIEQFYSAIPTGPRQPGSDLISIRSNTRKTVISLDLMDCPDCGRMHLKRFQIMTKGPEIKPGEEIKASHDDWLIRQDPNDPNNYLIQ